MATRLEITINDKTYTVDVGDLSASPVHVVVNGVPKSVTWQEAQPEAQPAGRPEPEAPSQPAPEADRPEPEPAPEAVATGEGTPVKAPMPGKILSVRVQVGDEISEGDTICTLEAMKMEMPINSTVGGTVTAVPVQVGQNVAYDDTLVIVGD